MAVAVGKCEDELDIDPGRVTIRSATSRPAAPTEQTLAEAAEHTGGREVVITVELGIAEGAFTAYGCDLTDGYIRINADYTT